MENQEKNNKLIYILTKNINKVRSEGDSFRYLDGNIEIKLKYSVQIVEAIIEPRNFIGFKYNKIIRDKSYKPVGRLISYVNGFCYDSNVSIDVLNDFKKLYQEYHNNVFEEKLNTIYNGKG